MKRLKVGKYISCLGDAREVLIKERHNKCQKFVSGARKNIEP
jgi:hypothetical protein